LGQTVGRDKQRKFRDIKLPVGTEGGLTGTDRRNEEVDKRTGLRWTDVRPAE